MMYLRRLKLVCAMLAVVIVSGCAATSNVQALSDEGNVRPAVVKIDFTSDSITPAIVEGDAGVAGRAVTIDDPARVASISKLVVAIGVMRLSEQGKLDLDRDVNEYLGWRVRNPAFPNAPITLRALLSHQSSLRDTVDYIVPLDGSLETVLANPKAWDVDHAPGTYFSYANINSPLIAAVLESATGERFDRLMARLVLTPLGLDACYNWGAGCGDGRRVQAVTLLRPNGDLARDAPMNGPDPCAVYPASNGSCDVDKLYVLGRNGSAFSPQGGLRISARDLAKIGQLLLRDGAPLLSRESFTQMIGPVWTFDGKNGDDDNGYFTGYGLGVHWLTDKAGHRWFGHVGEAYSLRAGFWINPTERRGFYRYVTMVDEFSTVGHCFDRCP
ncbi:class C beta-lactamase-related serine hydrolase [Sphingorhabdus wooponensis]|jgi:CubicO group peptidase (beta-lactamase class C family)|uniref:Class C beta-lactamase-related serine hydrolase n=1 Tax=Sphingorhabdus wooponensis TaxID=940136 RepID=A0A3R8R745_9SPHN|nr:class C beta-lactamase-related serine hydrolase [Sphingorhabdus wooponensis]